MRGRGEQKEDGQILLCLVRKRADEWKDHLFPFRPVLAPEHLVNDPGADGDRATAGSGGTRVTGSTYLFDMQIARFFATLPAVT